VGRGAAAIGCVMNEILADRGIIAAIPVDGKEETVSAAQRIGWFSDARGHDCSCRENRDF